MPREAPRSRADGAPSRGGAVGRFLRQPRYRHADVGRQLHSGRTKTSCCRAENGLLGIGPFPYEGDEDPDLINAGTQTVTTIAGSAFFDSAQSFAMIRGGHVDVSVLGAMRQRARRPRELDDPRQDDQGHGRRDGSRRRQPTIVMMEHTAKDGSSKILLRECFFATAHRRALRPHDRDRPRGDRREQGGARAARTGARGQRRRHREGDRGASLDRRRA